MRSFTNSGVKIFALSPFAVMMLSIGSLVRIFGTINFVTKKLFLDKHENEVGRITKYWAGGRGGCGCCIECFNASTYVIKFPAMACTEQKAALVGTALLLVYIKYYRLFFI